jgi:UDP-N-acetylmuramate--alanine ligase
VAVVNNISLDHKSMDELRRLFGDFAAKARTVVLNLDNAETAALAANIASDRLITYSIEGSLASARAGLVAGTPTLSRAGIEFSVMSRNLDRPVEISLKVPGRHNAANALAAIAATGALGVGLREAAAAMSAFTGVRRRLELVGEAKGITVIDDFAHNPDKIAATLDTLHAFPGRLLVMFQPHGYGPLRLMGEALVDCFAERLTAHDELLMPEPVYFGGTVDRSVTSDDIVKAIANRGRSAAVFADRAACGDRLIALARPGDRIVIMGARDDSLSVFAAELVERMGGR